MVEARIAEQQEKGTRENKRSDNIKSSHATKGQSENEMSCVLIEFEGEEPGDLAVRCRT